MGISRDSRHKRRLTGGRRNIHQKKRKFELGRQPAMTKIGSKRVAEVRVRGGAKKFRALRLDTGNFSWGTETCTRKTRILDVVYNASNNELVRTKTLVKNAVIQVDATPFRVWYEQRYGTALGKKKTAKDEEKSTTTTGASTTTPASTTTTTTTASTTSTDAKKHRSKKVEKKLKQRNAEHTLDTHLKEQFNSGRLYACIASRPGQSGRCDGYILEAKELEFYLKKMQQRKK